MQTERANQMLEIINIDTGDHIPYAGTSLMGHVTTTYDKLVKTFGMPDLEPGDKTTCEWHIEFMVYDEDEGEFPMYATIYDYKEDSTHRKLTFVFVVHHKFNMPFTSCFVAWL
jgi:hypothetical protein